MAVNVCGVAGGSGGDIHVPFDSTPVHITNQYMLFSPRDV